MEEPSEALTKIVTSFGPKRRMGPEARILHDLGINGDDAWELMERLTSTFGTRFEAMPFAEFFDEESEAFWAHIASLVKAANAKKPLTLRHLQAVIDRGEWFEPSSVG